MIEVRHLRYAVMAADERSFARAATAFNMKQSTLSRKVLRLEDQLGFRLFDRTTRGACPTDVARPFLDAARKIIDDLDGLQRHAQALQKRRQGRLALGYSGSLFSGALALPIGDFLKEHPDVQFDGYERSPEQLFEALRAGLVDAIIAPCGQRGRDEMQMPLWSEPLWVCFSSSHTLAKVDPIRWIDLKQAHFVLPAGGLGPVIRNILMLRLGDMAAETDVGFQETGPESILGLVSITGKATLTIQPVTSHLTEAVQCRQVYDAHGLAHLDFALHWCEANKNPALLHFREMLRRQLVGCKPQDDG